MGLNRTTARADDKANKTRVTTSPTLKVTRPRTEVVDDRAMDFTFKIAVNCHGMRRPLALNGGVI